jgi:hypothetical protein
LSRIKVVFIFVLVFVVVVVVGIIVLSPSRTTRVRPVKESHG